MVQAETELDLIRQLAIKLGVSLPIALTTQDARWRWSWRISAALVTPGHHHDYGILRWMSSPPMDGQDWREAEQQATDAALTELLTSTPKDANNP